MAAEDVKEWNPEEVSELTAEGAKDEGNNVVEEGEGDSEAVALASSSAHLKESLKEEEQSHDVEEHGAVERQEKILLPSGYGGGKESNEEEDCPFCAYMKFGECGESFENWEKCINESEKAGEDVVEKCAAISRLLTLCMRANAEYYGPVLQAEKAAAASIAASAEGHDDYDGSVK